MDNQISCIIHVKDSTEDIKKLSQVSYSKIIECAEKWKNLDSIQQHVALQLNLNCELSERFGYHPQCYRAFTSIRNIEQAKKRVETGKPRVYVVEDESLEAEPTTSTTRSTSTRSVLLRSTFVRPNIPGRSIHILPPQCIICEKQKRKIDRHSGIKGIEKLVSCETDAKTLIEAAKYHENSSNPEYRHEAERILLQLGGRDPVSLELKYHISCYKKFTKCVYPTHKGDQKSYLNESFTIFFRDIIEAKIIDNGEVFRLNKLRDLFLSIVQSQENVTLTSYRTFSLKKRIKNRYPEISFVKQSVTTSELVLYNSKDSVCYNLDDIDFSSDSTDSDTDDESTRPISSRQSFSMNSKTRDLYISAQCVKKDISDCKHLESWPPTSTDVTAEKVAEIVPSSLFNFIAWCTNKSDVVDNCSVQVSEETRRKIHSICQDIIFLASSSKKLMPKHVALSMAIRHISGSSKLIDLLNGLGHCMSNSFTLEHDTALAHQQLLQQNSIPQGMKEGQFTTLVWDNNDFGEETLSGKGTSHNTNGIMIQRVDSDVPASQVNLPCLPRTKKRRLSEPSTSLLQYFPKKREGPSTDQTASHVKPVAEHESMSSQEFNLSKTAVTAFYFAKFIQDARPLPGWTGCNILTARVPPHAVHHIGYMPVIHASPTQMSTVYTVLQKSLDITHSLHLDSIVIVVDQALYAKVQEIRWQEKGLFQSKIIVRLGEFHTSMSFLGVLGKRFGDAGLREILVDSGVVAEGSLTGVLSGSHYNRSLRCHKLVCDALLRLQIQEFIDDLNSTKKEETMSVLLTLKESFPKTFNDVVSLQPFRTILESFHCHVEKRSGESVLYEFWNSYIKMIQLLLQFLQATREGNWKLHLYTIRCMMPWFFSYGRINYSRYLPVYLKEMMELETCHPTVHEHFCAGDFAVQRQPDESFSMTACDQVIEQTLNRDSKTKGGMRGFSLDSQAVDRWVISHASRAAISNALFQMVKRGDQCRLKSELSDNRIERDENDVLNIMDTLKVFGNPFTYEIKDKLVHLASGVEANQKIQEGYMSAKEEGDRAFLDFYSKRLVEGSVSLFNTISLPKVKSFADMTAKPKTKRKLQSMSVKEDKELYMRLILIAQERKIDLQNLLAYPLCKVPASLGNCDGTLRRTEKSVLIKCIEKEVPSCLEDLQNVTHYSTALIIDGMALIRQQKSSQTLEEFASKLLRKIISLMMFVNASRVDFVIDMYYEKSIKAMERMRRTAGKPNVVRVLKREQKMPSSLPDFLSVDQNKVNLLELLWEEWQSCWNQIGRVMFMCHGNKCDSLSFIDGRVQIESIPDLSCDHEEADTRMYLHAQHAAKVNNQRVVIYSNDTDVFVIGTSLYHILGVNELYAFMSSGPTPKFLNLATVSRELNETRAKAMIGLHAFSGCDSVSSFLGKGKQKMFSFMMESSTWQTFFSTIGVSWEISSDLERMCEKATCQLYGWPEVSEINSVRYNCFRFTDARDSALPPTRDSLLLHLQRANYQARIWRSSLNQRIEPPAPERYGWYLDHTNSNVLCILWSNLPIAPSNLLNITICSCKKSSCERAFCSCVKHNLKCHSMCRCINCKNTVRAEIHSDASDSGDE